MRRKEIRDFLAGGEKVLIFWKELQAEVEKVRSTGN